MDGEGVAEFKIKSRVHGRLIPKKVEMWMGKRSKRKRSQEGEERKKKIRAS